MTTARRRVVAGALSLCVWFLAAYAAPLHAEDTPLEKRHLIAAVPGNMPPLYFLDGKTGEARGFGVDVIRAVANNLDLEIYFKVFPTSREAMDALWAGQVDILPSAGVLSVKNTVHPSVLVTDPFHTFRASLFVREGFIPPDALADYPAGKLGVFDRPTIRKWLEGRVQKGYVPFVDPEAAVLALLSSGIDGFVGPEEVFRYLTRHMRLDSHFQRAGLPLFEIKRGIFVHGSLPKVHQALNTEINAFIHGGKYSRLFMIWFGEPLTGYPVIPVIGAFLSAALLASLVVFFWRHRLLLSTNRNLERIVHERTESLRQQVTERTAAERELLRAKETLEERVFERTEDLKREMEERLRTENELLESQKRYGAIFQGSRVVMLLIDPEDGSIVDANPSACEFYGYDHALFTRMKIWEINTLPPEVVKERMDDAVAQKKSCFLFDHRLASGEIRHIDGRPTPLQIEGKTYIFLIVVDVTEHMRAENALRESEGLLTAILDNSPMVILLKDCDGRYLLVNTRFLDSHNLTIDQVIGKKSHDFLPREFADEGRLYDQRVIEEKRSISYESLLPKGDGKEGHLLSVKFPLLDAAGNIFAIGTISNDITDLKQAEKALRHSQRLETVGQLTGGVAHDFNNMLGVIIMNLEFLRDIITDVPERALPALDAIQKAAWRGADLTKRLLAFSRKSNNNVTKVNVNELLQSMKDLLERTLTESVEIHIDATPGLWTIEVEEGGLEDALLNLAINSRDAMANGGELTIVTRNMVFCDEWIGNRPDIKPGEYVLLEVADNGPGNERGSDRTRLRTLLHDQTDQRGNRSRPQHGLRVRPPVQRRGAHRVVARAGNQGSNPVTASGRPRQYGHQEPL